jgi:hypothetical protein
MFAMNAIRDWLSIGKYRETLDPVLLSYSCLYGDPVPSGGLLQILKRGIEVASFNGLLELGVAFGCEG